LYIKHHFPINKQFSIDSFLDWKGHCDSFLDWGGQHWVSLAVSTTVFSPGSSLHQPQHITLYWWQLFPSYLDWYQGHTHHEE